MKDMRAGRSWLLRLYKNFSVLFTSALILFLFCLAILTIFLPQVATDVVGRTIETFSESDGCSGGYGMQMKDVASLKFSLSTRYFDERCADYATSLDLIDKGLQYGQPEVTVLGLVVLRKISPNIDASGAQVVEAIRKVNASEGKEGIAELCALTP